jgi:ABC-type uncharacterized transport system involved in gliding motility auxiliary subunit
MKGTSALLGALGGVAIVFALLSTLLFVASPIATGDELYWIFGNLVLGILLLAAAFIPNWGTVRERMRSGEARRAGKYGTSAVLSTLLAVAILWLLAYLASSHPRKFDWSEAGVHTLSEQSKSVLASLTQDVAVTALVGALDAPPVRDLLDRYAYESPRFQVEYADPNGRPDLVEKFGIAPETLTGGVVHVALGAESVDVSEFTEEKLTNALVKLTRTGKRMVYVLEGHGERATAGEGANDREGFSQAVEALKNENYVVEKLLLASKGDVPDDANVVLVPGPSRPLLPEEMSALERYLAKGGALLVLLDPPGKSGPRSDFPAKLATWGVKVGDDVVVDPRLGILGRAAMPFAAQYPTHPITKGLREPTVYNLAASVTANDDAKGRFTEIVRTGEESWAESDLARLFDEGQVERGDGDRPGPVSVAVAGEPLVPGAPAADAAKPDAAAEGKEGEAAPGPKKPRLVVFGDSDFASNEFLDAYRNRDLFVNSVNWLLGDVESIAVRPNRSRASRMQLSTEEFLSLRFLSLFVLPELIAFAGAWAWWSRRRAPGR